MKHLSASFGRAAAVLIAASGPGMADVPPPRHERASSWRTIVIPAEPDRPPNAVGRGRIETASLTRPADVTPAPRLLGPGHAMGGIASYYWQDQKTSSGETFDRHALTAAHPTLPFGTRVRVTHVRNGRSVVVRINDRGPFKKGRVVDLSEAAAKVIGMTGAGLAHVRLDVVSR